MAKPGNKRQSQRIRKAKAIPAPPVTIKGAEEWAQSVAADREEELRLATMTPGSEDIISLPALPPPDDPFGRDVPVPADGELALTPKHTITVMTDHILEYPELYMEIHIVGKDGNSSDALFAQFFARAACRRAESIDKADLVVFVGGPDINPGLYGEKPHKSVQWNDERDTADIKAYLYCMENGIPMLGVCRGAQLIHALKGGKLYQHVDQHHGDHPIIDCVTKQRIERISSVHHQMVMVNKEMEILATANKARNRWRNPEYNDVGVRADIEAFFYRDICAIGIQGHPEYRTYNYFSIWALNLIKKYVIENNDLDWMEDHRYRRLRPELLKARTEGVLRTVGRGVN